MEERRARRLRWPFLSRLKQYHRVLNLDIPKAIRIFARFLNDGSSRNAFRPSLSIRWVLLLQ